MRTILIMFSLMLFTQLKIFGQTLLQFIDNKIDKDSIYVSTFATGNVKALASGDLKSEMTTNGALGINMAIEDLYMTGIINVASTLDTLKGSYSSLILNPSNGSGLRAGLLDVRLSKIIRNFNLHCYASISTSSWKLDSLANDVTVGGIGILLHRQLIAENEENKVSLELEIGFSTRVLLGELSSNESLRLQYLKSKNKIFGGIEAGMTIGVNNLVASLQFYYFIGNRISGITDGQLTTGISLRTSLFSFKSKLND